MWRGNHQAGGGKDAVGVGIEHRVFDFARGAEVIGGDDKVSSTILSYETIMSSRLRRNWKNSTPSRRRRTSMSRLVSISLTISAILEGRK